MGAYAAAAGLVLGGIGTIFSAQDARRTKNQLRDLANTPGLDIESEIGASLGSYGKNVDQAGKLAGQISQADADILRQLLSTGVPGYEKLQGMALGNIESQLAGQLDPEIMALIDRTAAARGIQSGTAGSEFNQFGALRNYGTTAMGQQQQGLENLLSLIQGTPMAPLTSTAGLLGPTIADRIGIRANERTQRLNIMQGSIVSPGTDAIIGNWLQSTGGALAGGGAASLGGGSGFSSKPTSGAGGGLGVTPLNGRS